MLMGRGDTEPNAPTACVSSAPVQGRVRSDVFLCGIWRRNKVSDLRLDAELRGRRGNPISKNNILGEVLIINPGDSPVPGTSPIVSKRLRPSIRSPRLRLVSAVETHKPLVLALFSQAGYAEELYCNSQPRDIHRIFPK